MTLQETNDFMRTADDRKQNFTQSWIDKIALPERKPDGTPSQVEYMDKGQPDLYLRVTSTGSKGFFVRRWCSRAGGAVRVNLGKYDPRSKYIEKLDGQTSSLKDKLSVLDSNPRLNLAQARRLAEAVRSNLVEAKDEKQRRADATTLGELFEEYMTRHMSKKRTGDAMRKDFERDFGHWSKREISTITSKDCDDLHARIGKNKGKYAANRRIQLLRAMFNKAIKWKLLAGSNPCADITLFEEYARDRFLTEDEASRLWRRLEQIAGDTIGDYIRISMLSGARRQNVLSMRWSEIDFNEKEWTIPPQKLKTGGSSGRPHVVALTELEISILKHRRIHSKSNEWVFPSIRGSKSGHLQEPKSFWNQLRKELEIEDVTLHDLRRSLASNLSGKTDTSVTTEIMNHNDYKTTLKHYQRANQEKQRQAKLLAHEVFVAAPADEPGENVTQLRKKDKPAAKKQKSKRRS